MKVPVNVLEADQQEADEEEETNKHLSKFAMQQKLLRDSVMVALGNEDLRTELIEKMRQLQKKKKIINFLANQGTSGNDLHDIDFNTIDFEGIIKRNIKGCKALNLPSRSIQDRIAQKNQHRKK